MSTDVAFIGLGAIGLPLALALIRAGYRVHGFRRRMAEAFVDAGGRPAGSPRAAAAAADVIVHCLPSVAALDDVVSGPDGILQGARAGQIVVDLSTYPVAAKERVAATLAARGVTMLDCEVSGNPTMVVAGTATIFVSGDRSAIDAVMPVLEAMAGKVIDLGEFGGASRMKVLTNALVAVHTLAGAEALAVGARAGMDPQLILDVISNSAAASTVFALHGPSMVARDWQSIPGSFRSFEKYVHLARDLAAESGVATPLIDAATACFLEAIAQGRTDQSIAAIIEVIERGGSDTMGPGRSPKE